MPHPERFYDACDGDQIFQSMYQWITNDQSPKEVIIGDLSAQKLPTISKLESPENAIWLEKTLIITDNEAFSVRRAAQSIVGQKIHLEKSIIFAITGEDLSTERITDTGLIFNANKERCITYQPKPDQFLVQLLDDDHALHLGEQLSEILGQSVSVQMYKAWDFAGEDTDIVEQVLKNGLLCNSNAAQIFTA